jgi:hypothetical protein
MGSILPVARGSAWWCIILYSCVVWWLLLSALVGGTTPRQPVCNLVFGKLAGIHVVGNLNPGVAWHHALTIMQHVCTQQPVLA